MKILIIYYFNIIISVASYLILPTTNNPNILFKKPTIPHPYGNFFSLDGDTAGLIRNIVGPNIIPETLFNYGTTTQSTWTRATTPKDILIEYIERALDKLFRDNYQSHISSIDKNTIEADSLLIDTNSKLQTISTNETEEEEQFEGSGENEKQSVKPSSSISGIPNIFPNIPKVPIDFTAAPLIPTPTKLSDVESIIKNFKLAKPNVPKGGFGPLLKVQKSNIRRHPGAGIKYSKTTAEKFEYGLKPTYKQGLINSALHFLGIHGNSLDETKELDKVLTEWILQHTPTYQTKAEKNANIESSYNTFQKFIAHSVMPLCTPQPESIQDFNVKAFMGQWFQVMYSPLVTLNSCSMMNYKMLTETPNGIGSTFQTIEYSMPQLNIRLKKNLTAIMSSGYAMVSRPGQLIYHKSNSLEEDFVHVIHVSKSPLINERYEYAVLSVNCNYPLYVIARDPDVFQQKYFRIVNAFLERKGLINQVSRLLNIIKPVDFSQCSLTPNLFKEIQ